MLAVGSMLFRSLMRKIQCQCCENETHQYWEVRFKAAQAKLQSIGLPAKNRESLTPREVAHLDSMAELLRVLMKGRSQCSIGLVSQ